MDNLQERMGSLQEGIAWIRGKLEGKHESDAALWGKIAVLAAVGSAIIAVLAHFKIRKLKDENYDKETGKYLSMGNCWDALDLSHS